MVDHPAITFVSGDVRDFDWPTGRFAAVIHGAAEASAALIREQPLLMIDTIVAGTRNVLEFAKQRDCERFLFLSSGAVYGRQPAGITHVAIEQRVRRGRPIRP